MHFNGTSSETNFSNRQLYIPRHEGRANYLDNIVREEERKKEKRRRRDNSELLHRAVY